MRLSEKRRERGVELRDLVRSRAVDCAQCAAQSGDVGHPDDVGGAQRVARLTVARAESVLRAKLGGEIGDAAGEMHR